MSHASSDQYLLGYLSPAAPATNTLRRSLAIDAQCSPFEVQLRPIIQCGPSSLLLVGLPGESHQSPVTDIWPMGRLASLGSSEEQQRVVSVAQSLWPMLCRPERREEIITVRMGDPVLFAFQFRSDKHQARIYSSGALGNRPAPKHSARRSYIWARDWLANTLESGGWRVSTAAAGPSFESDKAVGL